MLDLNSRHLSRYLFPLTVAVALSGAGCGGEPPGPVEGHPRLFLTQADVERLRSWATPSNPFYSNGIEVAAKEFKARMDQPNGLDSECKSDFIFCEWFMENFAFMSLVAPDPDERDDYARRARTILMNLIQRASEGPVDGGSELVSSKFSVGDRSRGAGRAFGLTVDWIYPYLSGSDKALIRQVFLRWADENVHATVTNYNHPEPVGVYNDPVLLENKDAVRFAGNNYFTAHGRNLAFMALALDPADDPGGELHAYLDPSIGGFLYMTDATLREDALGGLCPEGYEYGPLTMSYTMEHLFALHSAGYDDPATYGDQVSVEKNPFWSQVVPGFIHSLAPSLHPLDYPGPYHDYASFGDQETYEPYSSVQNDPILSFAPLAIMARERGDEELFNVVRWIEMKLPPGGDENGQLVQRSSSVYSPLNAIAYFMLMDPDAGAPVDPRPKMPLHHYAEGLRFLMARTGWEQKDSYFTYQVTWTGIDHRHGDANNFGLHRKGEWITKEHTGYGADESEVHNTMAIENDQPSHDDSVSTKMWKTGSQYTYFSDGDGAMLGWSVGDTYAFGLGDATDIYNSSYNGVTDVIDATRSIVWLKPDHVVIYDRAETATEGRYKRFCLQTPSSPQVSGKMVTATTKGGQLMFLTSLLPTDASISTDVPVIEYNAGGEPMTERVKIEVKGKRARFLNVVQGADAGASADPAVRVSGTGSVAYDGAVVRGTLVAFPEDLGKSPDSVSFEVADTTEAFVITGLEPNAAYSAQVGAPEGGKITVIVTAGGDRTADQAGVLAF